VESDPETGDTHYAIVIPGGLSLLVGQHPAAVLRFSRPDRMALECAIRDAAPGETRNASCGRQHIADLTAAMLVSCGAGITAQALAGQPTAQATPAPQKLTFTGGKALVKSAFPDERQATSVVGRSQQMSRSPRAR
jgi:hypothetical protein